MAKCSGITSQENSKSVGRYTRCPAENITTRKVTMEQPQQATSMPKKSCMITLMFGIDNDQQALDVKKQVDVIVKDIKDKRYNFQINEV